MVKIVLPPLIVLTDSQGNWGRRSGRLSVGQALAVMRCLVGHAMRSASPLRAGLASAGGQKPQLGGCSGLGGPGPLAVGRGARRRAGQDLMGRREMSGVGRCFSMALPVVWKCFSLVGSSFCRVGLLAAVQLSSLLAHPLMRITSYLRACWPNVKHTRSRTWCHKCTHAGTL